jgi:lysophospholipase L1-like esterase
LLFRRVSARVLQDREDRGLTGTLSAGRGAVARAIARVVGHERAIQALEREGPAPSRGIVFAGSSTIRLWRTLSKDFPGLPVTKRGFGGACVADVARFAERIIVRCEPRVVVLLVGGNDLADGLAPEAVADTYRSLVDALHRDLPEARVLALAVGPTVAFLSLLPLVHRTNALLRALAEERGWMDFVDTASPMLDARGLPRRELLRWDGVHLNAAGYRLLACVVRPELERVWNAPWDVSSRHGARSARS